jgi:AcrR family transcriptional regulator
VGHSGQVTRIAPKPGRSYRSELREQQAEATRARILDATLRLMAGGLASLSIPAVAREAGVSVPTVYRHFKTKADLLAGLYPHVMRRSGFAGLPEAQSYDDLRQLVHAIFERLDGLDDLARAALASPVVDEARAVSMKNRYELSHRLGDSVEPKLAKADQDRIARLLVVLLSSASLRMWRDHLGASVDQTADDVDWILRAAVAAATSRNRQ